MKATSRRTFYATARAFKHANTEIGDSIHTYNTRNRSNFHLDSVNTTFGKRSLKFKGAMLWNSLPASSREPMSGAKFKKLIKSYLTADSEN